MPIAPLRTTFGLLALSAPLALATSCASAGNDTEAATGADAAIDGANWLAPSADLQREIDVRAMQVSVIASPDEYAEQFDWWVGVGEPAYSKLIEMIRQGDTRQRSFALTVAGAIGDQRLARPVEAAMPSAALENRLHAYEYARALAKLGDFSELPILIEGLNDENELTRRQAYKALTDVTRNEINYSPTAPPEERAKSAAAWMAWWRAQQADTLLQQDG